MSSQAKHPDNMSKREILEALSGLYLAMFVTMISGTIVGNALPVIIGELHGTQTQYTWIVTATLLTTTATTPIWGKLGDLFEKKLLTQLALGVFVISSIACGFAPSTGWLIVLRGLQGIGLGGVQALAQTVMAAMISPRERGKYNGYMGAVMAGSTIGGPLIGGAIVDSPLGWRWVFFFGVPLAIAAMVVLQKTLHLQRHQRDVHVDYLGATLITGGVSVLLMWITFAGRSYPWLSTQSAVLVPLAVVLLVAAVFVERRAPEPIIPLHIVVQRTPALAIIGSLAVGIALFGSSVFLGQYFQIARGYSPTAAGLLALPMMMGFAVTGAFVGRHISKHGRYRRFMIAGSILLAFGFGMLAFIDHRTSMVFISVGLLIAGSGMGMTMQNLVLAVQNTVELRDIGASTSTVTFFRSLGGTMGVAALGAMVTAQLETKITAGLTAMGIAVPAGDGSQSLDVASMPAPVAELVRASFGDVTGNVFKVSAVLAILGTFAIAAIREVPLRTSIAHPKTDEEAVDTGILIEQ